MELKQAADYGIVTGSPAWVRKMRTLFRRLDSNGHGYISVDDFLNVISKVLTVFHRCDNCYSDELVQAVIHIWYGVICTNGNENTRTMCHMNEADFIESMLKCVNTNLKTEFDALLVDSFFDLADIDHDGSISMQEFSGIMDSWQADVKEADLLFRLTTGGNAKGLMSKKQFGGVMAEYIFDEELKGKSVKLWGPLINYKRPEDYPECECGPTWEGKMRTMFRRLDINQAGKLRCHDFIQIGRSLAQRSHLSKQKTAAVMRTMLELWVHFFSLDKEAFENGKTGSHFSELTEKEFIHNLRSMINGEFRHALDQFGWTFFKAVEVEGTGFLSISEYRNLQEAWHVGRDEAEGMFKILDTDKDGRISSDEYLSAWVDYFLGEDPSSVYRTFFGPVVSKPV